VFRSKEAGAGATEEGTTSQANGGHDSAAPLGVGRTLPGTTRPPTLTVQRHFAFVSTSPRGPARINHPANRPAEDYSRAIPRPFIIVLQMSKVRQAGRTAAHRHAADDTQHSIIARSRTTRTVGDTYCRRKKGDSLAR